MRNELTTSDRATGSRYSRTISRPSRTEAALAELAALADDLLGAAMATRRSEALLVRTQAACLAWLTMGDRAQRCGYSSLSRLALDVLGLSPRTVRERLSLNRLLVRFPAAERAFLEGRMSACQALAAAPILNELRDDDELMVARWIETAGRVSVRALRYEVRSQRAAKTQPNTPDADAGYTSDDNDVVPNDTDQAGPPDAAGIDPDKRVQPGTSDATGADPDDRAQAGTSNDADASPDEGADHGASAAAGVDPSATTLPATSAAFNSDLVEPLDPCAAESIDRSASDATHPDTSDPGDSDPAASIDSSAADATDPPASIDPSSPDATDPEGRMISFTAPVGFQIVFDQTLDLARKVLGWEAPIHECIAAILAEANWAGVGSPPKDPRWLRPPARITVRPRADVPIRPEAIAHARATLDEVHGYIGDVLDLVESGEPRSPRDALLRLRQIQLLRSPQRVLFAHLIRDLRRTYAMDLLGYRSMAELVEDRLGLSERSARNRVAESLLFESDQEIEGAVGRGEISLMQAHLIRRLHCADIEPFVERARETSWRQFQREYRLLDLLRKCGLGRLTAKPLPQSRIEEGLIEALGGDRKDIEEKLRQWGIPPLPPDGASDPAQNYILMERLEALVEMLASTKWDEVPKTEGLDRQMSAAPSPLGVDGIDSQMSVVPAPRSNDEVDRQTSAANPLGAEAPDRQTSAANPLGVEAPDRQTSAMPAPRSNDEIDRQTFAANPLGAEAIDRQTSAALSQQVRIRFWAPNPTADDFEGVIDRFRKRHSPRISTWAALVILFAQVKEEWEREDPERRPVRAKILKRDHYRCVVPGCGRRSQLEDHHIRFRSQGGGNDDANRITLCHAHHAHMVHKGYVRITGKAPYALRFELGCLEDGPPIMVLLGEKIISKMWA